LGTKHGIWGGKRIHPPNGTGRAVTFRTENGEITVCFFKGKQKRPQKLRVHHHQQLKKEKKKDETNEGFQRQADTGIPESLPKKGILFCIGAMRLSPNVQRPLGSHV